MRMLQGKWGDSICHKYCPTILKRYCCFLKPAQLSKDRLRVRLNYLSNRYREHAPYWQFVVWGRQISLLVLNYMISDTWLFASLAVLITLIVLAFHIVVKPFQYDYQNEVEQWLSAANILILLFAAIYTYLMNSSNGKEAFWTMILTICLMTTMIGSMFGAMYHLRLFKHAWALFKAFCNKKGIEDSEYSLLENSSDEKSVQHRRESLEIVSETRNGVVCDE